MSQFDTVLSSTKKIFVGGNWKCNGTVAQAETIITGLNNAGPFSENVEVVIAVPSIHLVQVKAKLREDISVSSQDVCIHTGVGAYTGEISPTLLSDIGIKWTIVGHSERRTGFGFPGEPDSVVAKKVKSAIDGGLKVIACVGEQLADRESGATMTVVSTQLTAISTTITPAEWKSVVIAYEPVWAIGTGKVATPEQAEETHAQIRDWITNHVSPEVANEVRIIYGGSVNAANSVSILAGPNIDGFLVGGASLKTEFIDIIRNSKK